MKAFMMYISWEVLALYLATAAMYIAGTAAVVVLLWMRGEQAGATVLAPVVALSWAGLLWQVGQVAKATADMRRHLTGRPPR
jgi:hypothetical protein